jgi:outer membrane protein TolC
MKYLILLFICCLSPITFSRSLTPTEIANLAEERAPLIKMQLENSSAANRQISQSKLLGNPAFVLQSGSLRSGTQSGGVVDVSVNQPIPWPGKRAAEINSAKILEKISHTDVEESKLIVNHSAALMSLEYASLVELARHNKERKQRFSVIHRFLTSRPLASPRQMVEKNLIETQIRLVETQMYDIETKLKSVGEQIMLLTGESELEVNINWNLAAHLPSKESLSPLLEDGPDVKRSKRQEDLAMNRIEQARYLAKPDILVGVNYRQENIAPTNHFYHANLAVVIPIVDRGQHSIEIARAQARREEANKKMVMISSLTALNRSYQALQSAYHSTQVFKVSELKRIERQFNQAEDAFRKGRIDVTTFLQSDLQIHESIDLAYVSFIKFYTALSEINLLTGQKLAIQ